MKSRLVTVSVSMSKDLARLARVRAAQQGKSRSAFIREALERTLMPGLHEGGQGQDRRAA